MPLIIEDGSIVPGADSYVSRADYIIFAEKNGITLVDGDELDVQLRQAAEYIDQHEQNLIGYRVERDQPMAYPRYDLYINDFYWANDEIPTQVIDAQLWYALDISAGVSLWNRPNNPNQLVKSERVEGAVKVEYAVGDSSGSSTRQYSQGDSIMSQLLRASYMRISGVRA